MWTSLSTNSLSRSSRGPRSRPPRSRSPAMVFSNPCEACASVSVQSMNAKCLEARCLEAQPAFASGISQRLDATVVQILPTIENHFLDAILDGALGQQLAHGLRRVHVRTGLAAIPQRLLQRRSRRQRLALQVVDDLRVDVLRRTEHRQTRTTIGVAANGQTNTLLAPGIRNLEFRHDPLRYFFLPSLRKMNSS